jgi:uncharacterized protein (TIGR03437 family)
LVAPAGFADSGTPATSGETITLWGTGFGPTNPAVDGKVVSAPVPAVTQPTVTIGAATANVTFAGVTSPGLYQLNVQAPANTPSGDATVVATAGTVKSQAGSVLPIQ